MRSGAASPSGILSRFVFDKATALRAVARSNLLKPGSLCTVVVLRRSIDAAACGISMWFLDSLGDALASSRLLSHLAPLAGAYVLAFPIAWNREKQARSAGPRTFPLVALDSCGFIQGSEHLVGDDPSATARIVEGVIIGFVRRRGNPANEGPRSRNGNGSRPLGNGRHRDLCWSPLIGRGGVSVAADLRDSPTSDAGEG